MGKSPDMPAPPDPSKTIKKDAQLNRIDTYTPFGSVTYQDTPAGPNTQMQVQFSPEQQALLSGMQQTGITSLQQAQARLNSMPVEPMTTEGLPAQVAGIDTSGFMDMTAAEDRAGQIQTTVPNYTGHVQDLSGQMLGGEAVDDRTGDINYYVDPRDEEIQRGIDLYGVQEIPGVQGGFDEARQRSEQATFERAMGLLDPQFAQQTESLRQTMANQGLPQGGEAYTDEFTSLRQDQSRAMEDAAYRAVLEGEQAAQNLYERALGARQQQVDERMMQGEFANQATRQAVDQSLAAAGFGNQAVGQAYQQDIGQAQFANQAIQAQQQLANQAVQQMFGQDLQSIQAGNQAVQSAQGLDVQQAQQQNMARDQQLAEAMQLAELQNMARQQGIDERLILRNQPIQEAQALLGVAPPPQMPSGGNPQSVNAQQAYNDQYAAQAAQAQAEAQSQQALTGSLLNLGGTLGAAAIMSDRRLKERIEPVGRLVNGIRTYVYSYLGQARRHVGVMAEEVAAVAPEAVITLPSGYQAVDYRKIV